MQLPRIDQKNKGDSNAAAAAGPSGLAGCFHLGTGHTARMEAIETIRNRKIQAQGDRGAGSLPLGLGGASPRGAADSSASPRRRGGQQGAEAAEPGSPGKGDTSARGSGERSDRLTGSGAAGTEEAEAVGGRRLEQQKAASIQDPTHQVLRRNNMLFCGLKKASLSDAGSWLDSKAFAGKDPTAIARKQLALSQHRRGTTGTRASQIQATENERFVLKRNKDALIRALKKRSPAQLQMAMTLEEFQRCTSGLLNPFEARFAYNRMNLGGLEKATLQEFVARLEEL